MNIHGYGDNLTIDNIRIGDLSPADHEKIEFAYKTSLGRKPTSREIDIIYNFLRTQEKPLTAWTHIFHGLFSSIDFRHVN